MFQMDFLPDLVQQAGSVGHDPQTSLCRTESRRSGCNYAGEDQEVAKTARATYRNLRSK